HPRNGEHRRRQHNRFAQSVEDLRRPIQVVGADGLESFDEPIREKRLEVRAKVDDNVKAEETDQADGVGTDVSQDDQAVEDLHDRALVIWSAAGTTTRTGRCSRWPRCTPSRQTPAPSFPRSPLAVSTPGTPSGRRRPDSPCGATQPYSESAPDSSPGRP